MIDILGKKRLITLGILIVANAVVGYGWYEGVRSAITDLEKKESGLQRTISQRRADLLRMQDEWSNITNQIAKFRDVEDSGLLDEPNLAVSSEIIDGHVTDAGILSATVDYGQASKVQSRQADQIGYVVLSKPITVRIDDAFDDNDVFDFVNRVQERFPGRINFSKLHIQRGQDFSVGTLQEITNGKPVGLIKGEYSFEWKSMVDKERVSEEWLKEQNKRR